MILGFANTLYYHDKISLLISDEVVLLFLFVFTRTKTIDEQIF